MFGNIRDADEHAAEFRELGKSLKRSNKNDRRVDQAVADLVADLRRLESLLAKPLVRAMLEHVQAAEATQDRLSDLEARINRI